MCQIYLHLSQCNCLEPMPKMHFFYIVQLVWLLINVVIIRYFIFTTEKFCVLFVYIVSEKIYYMHYSAQPFQELNTTTQQYSRAITAALPVAVVVRTFYSLTSVVSKIFIIFKFSILKYDLSMHG